MTELLVALLLLGTIAAFIIGLFYPPAWEGEIILALLAISMRIEKNDEAMSKLLATGVNIILGAHNELKAQKS